LAFVFELTGALIMAAATNFTMLASSVFVMVIGSAFYSGTIDALVFDTLKQLKKEREYDRKISTISGIQLLSPAICSIIGGSMYAVNPRLPFFASAAGYSIGFLASFLLVEPKVDTIKFSFHNFTLQTKRGLEQLFKTAEMKRQTILFLSIGFFIVISSEMLNSFLGMKFGFNGEQLSTLWSVIFLLSAGATQLTPTIRKRFGKFSAVLVGLVIAGTFIISPFVGLIIGGGSLLLRSALEGVFGNLASIEINNTTESKYRATTLSTFNMLKNIPYVLSAYFVGFLADKFSAKNIAFSLGLLLLLIVGGQLTGRIRKRNS